MLNQKKQILIKKAIMDACIVCKGLGCRSCASKVGHIDAWSAACIPTAYWDYSLDTFTGDKAFLDKAVELIKDVERLYMDGRSIVFMGRHGTGKTAMGTILLKYAITKHFTCFYTSMCEIVDELTSRENKYDFRKVLLSADFLMIDEVDQRFLPNSDIGKELFGTSLENIIRTRFQNKLPIIFCTNSSGGLSDVFDGTFEQTFGSLFSKSNLIIIPVGGIDLRKV